MGRASVLADTSRNLWASSAGVSDSSKEQPKVPSEPVASSTVDRTELRRVTSPVQLSDAEQLERLRNARKRCNTLGNEFRNELFSATGGITEKLAMDTSGRGSGAEGPLSIMALAHEAAEVFREHSRFTPRSDAASA